MLPLACAPEPPFLIFGLPFASPCLWQVTFVGDNYTRKAPKYERFIRPTGLRFKKAHVTHPELKATFCLNIIGVKKNPSSTLYTNLGEVAGEEPTERDPEGLRGMSEVSPYIFNSIEPPPKPAVF